MSVTVEELKKLAEQRKSMVTPESLKQLAEQRKPMEFKEFGAGVDTEKEIMQPKIERQPQTSTKEISSTVEQQESMFDMASQLYEGLPPVGKMGIAVTSQALTGIPILHPKQVKGHIDVAKRAWDLAGRPYYAFSTLFEEETPEELNVSNREYTINRGKKIWKALKGEHKVVMRDVLDRFVEGTIPDKAWVGKAALKTLADFGGEALDYRYWLIGKSAEPAIKQILAKAPKFMHKPIGQLFKKQLPKEGVNLMQPAFRGVGAKETTTKLIIDDEIARSVEGVFPDLAKKSGLTNKLTGRQVTKKLTQSMLSDVFDEKTRLPNYEAFNRIAPYLEKYAQKTGKNITVASIDVNKMKLLNTTFGEDVTDDIVKQLNNAISSHTQGHIAWFRPHPKGDELIGVTTMSEKETRLFIKKTNDLIEKIVFRNPVTGQPTPEPLTFGASVISSKPKAGAVVNLATETSNSLLGMKRAIDWHHLSPELRKSVIGRKFMIGGKHIKAELPKVIPVNPESSLRGATYDVATTKIGLSQQDLYNFSTKHSNNVYNLINKGGALDDIVDDVARLANNAGYTTKVKPILKAKPIKKQLKPELKMEGKKIRSIGKKTTLEQKDMFGKKLKIQDRYLKPETPEEMAASAKAMQELEGKSNLFTAKARAEQLRLGSQKLPKKAKPTIKPTPRKYYDPISGEEITRADYEFLTATGEDDLWTAIKKMGGIKSYKKGMAGALREEYRQVPIHLRNKQGLGLDEMAATLKEQYPYLNIQSESDLVEALSTYKYLQHAGIPVWKEINRTDKFLWSKEKQFGKWFWKKLRPITKQTIELSDEMQEHGFPALMEVDKPWWKKIKTLFGSDVEQRKVIEMVNKAKSQIFKDNRAFIEENPVIRKLFKLTPEERHAIFAIGEGRAMPTKGMRPEAIQVLKGLQELGDAQARELLQLSKEFGLTLTDDILKARRLQPLMKLTGEDFKTLVSQGLDPDKLIYFRHFDPKHFKAWKGKFLQFPIRKWKPGFLKKSKGLWSYLDDQMSDPALTVPVQNAEFTEFRVRYRLINDIKELIGKKIPKSGELLPGYVKFQPKGSLRFYPVETATGSQVTGVTKKGVETFQIPSAVKLELDSFLGRAGSLDKILNMTWDKATNGWRASVLALSPRWVVYNTLGNTTLNALGDVSPKAYIRSIKAFYNAGQIAKKEGISFNGALSRMGIPDEVTSGFYEAETGAALRHLGIGRFEAKKAWEKVANFAGWLPQKVYKVNSRVESFYRTAHFLDKIAKGYAPEKAVKSVNEFLFNYSALSWSERKILRRIIPFYAWTKNISRLAMTYPLKHPVRTGLGVLGAKTGTDYLRDEFGILIDWEKNEVKIPNGEGNTYYVMRLRGANPFADIVTPLDLFSQNGMTQFLSKVNPLIRVPIERATRTSIMPWGAQAFTAPVLKKDEWGREVRPLPSLPRHVATQFPQVQLAEKVTKPYATYTATGELIMGKRGRVYPRNPILDILRLMGANVRTENMSEVQKREMKKEYNDKKYELQKEIYKKRKEIVLDNWEQFIEQEPSVAQRNTPTADELRELAESRR